MKLDSELDPAGLIGYIPPVKLAPHRWSDRPYGGADSDSRPTFQESCSSDRPREKQVLFSVPTKSDEDIDLYFYRIRLKEVLDEKEYLVHELECARQQLDEVRSMNSEILRENRKLKRSLRTRDVEGISRNVLEKLGYCHDIFLCPNEVDVEKLQELLCRSECKLLYTVKIPGATTDHSWKVDTLAKMSPFCKVVFLGMIEDVYRLHRSGLCLNGKFSLKDFCWTLSQKVKFSAELKRSVLRRKLKRMRLDYQKLCEIMIEVLEECKVKIPADLEYLLDLMRDDPVKHQFLIRYNFCLMDDILKREETLTMFTQYEQLNREDREKHGKTTREYRTEIAVSFITLPRNIGSAMLANKFVAKIFERWRVETGFYSLDTRRKLIELIRHCMVHLPEKAFDEEKRTHYTDANVVDMVQILHNLAAAGDRSQPPAAAPPPYPSDLPPSSFFYSPWFFVNLILVLRQGCREFGWPIIDMLRIVYFFRPLAFCFLMDNEG
uniref:Uncharacterized protein n=1 Tax=Oryza sativa subsp. japonica TaxID=39947 RepID=Q6ZLJ6_ORYSJ|nr:hypothetical protein [Oryza sativa Japonica Group]